MRFEVYEPTMLQYYVYCPQKFKLRYVDGIEPPSSTGALLRGLVGHQILSNVDEDPKEIMDAAFMNYGSGLLKPQIQIDKADEREMRDELSTTIKNWYDHALRRGIEVLEREKTIEFKVKGIPFRGTIDLVFRYPQTPKDQVVIGDFKFGKRLSDRQLDRSIQHGLYYYGMRELGYEVEHNTWIQMMDLIPYKVNGKHGAKGDYRGQIMYPICITDRDRRYIEDTTVGIVDMIDKDYFPQASYGVQGPCTMCEFADQHCPRFKVGRRYQHDADMVAMSQSLKEEELMRRITWPTK